VLIAGTGAVAVRVGADGERTRADGWGIWLGDFGSGRWIGQEGLRRVLHARDGLAAETSLTAAAISAAGSLDALPRYVSGGGNPERVLGAFAPVVLEHALAGDRVADEIIGEATEHLARTTAACARPGEPLAVVGGLASSPEFFGRLADALAARGLEPRQALDDAVAGALLICAHPEFPHERSAIRVRR
jgi:N-acetylglucosamine kinase-like BadF-type ATPase